MAIAGMPAPVYRGSVDESLTRFFADPKMKATELDESIEELAMRLAWEEVRVGPCVRFDERAGRNLFKVEVSRFHKFGRVFGDPPSDSVRDSNKTLTSVLATMHKHRLTFVDNSFSLLIAKGLLGWWSSEGTF